MTAAACIQRIRARRRVDAKSVRVRYAEAVRALLTALCRLLLRIFFRRIESVGADRVPSDAPTIYVLNHPNALLDPLFIVCLSPRPVTFLAKAPLFSTFLVKHFVRAFECLPVYREQDGDDPGKNRASIEAAIALLAGGKALALFPEGTSHSDPKLRPLKTGAARIALSSSAAEPVLIVPVGLSYSDKSTFRSNALLVYGTAIETPRVELDGNARPPQDAADRLTAEIEAALARVTVQAQTHEAIDLARAAAQILAAADRDEGKANNDTLAGLELERRLVDGYERLRERAPNELARVVTRVRRYEAELARVGLPLDHPAKLERRRAIRYALRRLVALVLLLGPALIGIVTHFPAYRGVDWLAHRVAKSADVLGTLKLIAGFLLFPVTWLLLGGVSAWLLGWIAAVGVLLVLPACGYAALRFTELLFDFVERARGAWVLVTRRDVGGFLLAERRAIREAIVGLDAMIA
jgi:glycerol-3-phosphate O-acyltransferase/dihydroxyacetone phosphate acyltransferase